MGSLSPELKEVSDSFSNAYAEGGIEACRNVIAELLQEAELIKATAEAADLIDRDTVLLALSGPPEKTVDRLMFTAGATEERQRALSRYSFALFLLNLIEVNSGQ